LDNEKKKVVLYLEKLGSEKYEEPPFMKISFLSLLKVGITSNYIKSLGLILAFFVTAYENSRNFIEHSDFDEKKIDAYLDRGLAMHAAVIVILMLCSILIINLIRTVFKYFDYRITKKMGHYYFLLVC
jgi:putative membrane protein